MPGWHIVCEVSNGIEAVNRAKELKPDIILLDIGLPHINGIEAARQISKIAPGSKILFLSAFDSQDVVEEALGTGASGYVAKLDAAELVRAVEAVLQGERFVSSRLKAGLREEAKSSHTSDKPANNEHHASRAAEWAEAEFARCHEVLFYASDAVFLESVTQFIGSALKFGNGAIVFATKPHRDMLIEKLSAQGVGVDALLQQGTYVSLDVENTLSAFMINDWPDERRFFESFRNLIEAATKAAKAKHPRVAIFGEAVALLWEQGKRKAAIRLEQLGNDLAETRKVDILCAYPCSLCIQPDKDWFEAICAEHSAVHST